MHRAVGIDQCCSTFIISLTGRKTKSRSSSYPRQKKDTGREWPSLTINTWGGRGDKEAPVVLLFLGSEEGESMRSEQNVLLEKVILLPKKGEEAALPTQKHLMTMCFAHVSQLSHTGTPFSVSLPNSTFAFSAHSSELVMCLGIVI